MVELLNGDVGGLGLVIVEDAVIERGDKGFCLVRWRGLFDPDELGAWPVAWRARRKALWTKLLTSSSDISLRPPLSVATSNVRAVWKVSEPRLTKESHLAMSEPDVDSVISILSRPEEVTPACETLMP